MRDYRSAKSVIFFILLVLVGISLISLSKGISGYAPGSNPNQFFDSTIFVDGDNTEGPWNGTEDYPYQFIQDGIDAAISGETVFVYSGIYHETLLIEKPLNLIGEDKNNTIIDGSGEGKIIHINSDVVTIIGFTIQNCDFFASAIDISSSHQVTINDNKIINSGGITLYASSSNTISENIMEDNNFGVALFLSQNNTISENTISNNEYGVYMFFITHDNKVSDNLLFGNIEGIFMCGASNNTVVKNNISYNDNGVRVIGWSDNNSFYQNNFIGNNQHAFDERVNYWNKENPKRGNYWDDYTGTDSDGDGTGDIPYSIPGGNNFDDGPLMKPWTTAACGDVNDDGIVNVSDAVFIINYVFIPGSSAPDPICIGDANGDGHTNISDAVWIINYVFIPGSFPPVDDCC